ncbi:MAG: UDP-N-acetylmuramoyl-L-alanine--D-glutamate ligase [Deltaproteobacteria bacterium]
MRNEGQFKGKKVTVIGLARSGAACANLLKGLGADVRVSDNQDNETTARFGAMLASGIPVETGRHSDGFILDRDLIVVSPGVPFSAPPLKRARAQGIPVVSEIEIGWMLSPVPVIAVTGSNGKTTVTTLIGRVIDASGKKAAVCGNIGNPFTGELAALAGKKIDFFVLEVSSFQLETIRDFKPAVSVILNFNRNHLDRHADMEEYLAAKKRIFLNQDSSDTLVINGLDPALAKAVKGARARVATFGKREGYNANECAVLAAASALGIGEDICKKVFSGFSGLEHRFETAAEIKGVRFINDSKATTVESCLWALANLQRPVVLICGGKDKGVDYSLVARVCPGKVKEAILIGQAAEKIAAALGPVVPLKRAPSLEDAVKLAFETASPGDAVLLSPMCASFDMFTDYEHRGRVFKQAVRDLQVRDGQR